jgi:hypothetical protein
LPAQIHFSLFCHELLSRLRTGVLVLFAYEVQS